MIRTRLFSRGGGIIKSIDFIPPAPPPAPAPAPAPPPEPPLPPEPALPPVPIPVTGYPAFIYLTGVCCKSCCGGRGGCPCHHGYGIPHQPPSYDGDVGLVPSYDGWASGCRCDRSYGCRCGLVIEENPTCTIM
ncbi:hypothetical protein PVL29_012578 [Vitis rotundifolia]|uniref:Uncharacterized protein n=1 Tax=Vitis rotundifolia TaxID=103349 RepID=A0AA39DM93_VITRO|nr:hypothetical protein PVL29_012578 [Vitis rotundifolia]